LTPRATWRDPSAYDIKARDLVRRFGEHFATYAEAAPELSAAAPPL